MSVIGAQRKRFWEDYGFLVFPGFFDEDELAGVEQAYDRAWQQRPGGVVVDDIDSGRRTAISNISREERAHRLKVNDLYLTEERLRETVISARIGMILEELLGDEAAVCNTLNFNKGSQQTDHLDTLYMTPSEERGLVATWMALEDTHPDAGPLRYYPSSNHIPVFRFSTGSMHYTAAEMPSWAEHMAGGVERLGLGEERFLARRGDLFIWHALLLHGGCQIADRTRSRASLVTHYFTQTDAAEKLGFDLRPAPGGWWLNKPPLQTDEAVGGMAVQRELEGHAFAEPARVPVPADADLYTRIARLGPD